MTPLHRTLPRRAGGLGVDRPFLALILIEVVFGFLMLASASGPVSWNHFGNAWQFAGHQLIFGIIPGLMGMAIVSRLDYRRWARWSLPLFVAGIFAMLLVFVPGIAATYGSARSWLFVLGVSLQPTEFLKLAFIFYVAALFSSRNVAKPREALGPAGIAFGATAVLLMLQPDLGSLILFAGLFVSLIIAAGIPMLYVVGSGLAGILLIYVIVKAAPYRAARLTVFLHPELDPQGMGYQINQALLAIGSGGLFGLGLGHSRQKFQYLPQAMNDSIFPVIAEELGFFFALGLVALVVAIFFRGLRIARAARDPFARLTAIGIVSWFTIQAFLNIGGMLSLIPLTGLPLPFVSYGGSAMVAALLGAGVVLSISRGTERT